jgi:hypothetical protein
MRRSVKIGGLLALAAGLVGLASKGDGEIVVEKGGGPKPLPYALPVWTQAVPAQPTGPTVVRGKKWTTQPTTIGSTWGVFYTSKIAAKYGVNRINVRVWLRMAHKDDRPGNVSCGLWTFSGAFAPGATLAAVGPVPVPGCGAGSWPEGYVYEPGVLGWAAVRARIGLDGRTLIVEMTTGDNYKGFLYDKAVEFTAVDLTPNP